MREQALPPFCFISFFFSYFCILNKFKCFLDFVGFGFRFCFNVFPFSHEKHNKRDYIDVRRRQHLSGDLQLFRGLYIKLYITKISKHVCYGIHKRWGLLCPFYGNLIIRSKQMLSRLSLFALKSSLTNHVISLTSLVFFFHFAKYQRIQRSLSCGCLCTVIHTQK